jgi:hypothetical protein
MQGTQKPATGSAVISLRDILCVENKRTPFPIQRSVGTAFPEWSFIFYLPNLPVEMAGHFPRSLLAVLNGMKEVYNAQGQPIAPDSAFSLYISLYNSHFPAQHLFCFV